MAFSGRGSFDVFGSSDSGTVSLMIDISGVVMSLQAGDVSNSESSTSETILRSILKKDFSPRPSQIVWVELSLWSFILSGKILTSNGVKMEIFGFKVNSFSGEVL